MHCSHRQAQFTERLYPRIGPLRLLRATLSQMRLSELAVATVAACRHSALAPAKDGETTKAGLLLKLAFTHEQIAQNDQHFAGNREPVAGRSQTTADFAGQGLELLIRDKAALEALAVIQ
jgi:hypothetical protein